MLQELPWISLVAQFTANFDIQNLAKAATTITPPWKMETDLYFLKQRDIMLHQWDHRVPQYRMRSISSGGLSVHAGHITLLSGCRHGRQYAVPSPVVSPFSR